MMTALAEVGAPALPRFHLTLFTQYPRPLAPPGDQPLQRLHQNVVRHDDQADRRHEDPEHDDPQDAPPRGGTGRRHASGALLFTRRPIGVRRDSIDLALPRSR